MKLDFIPIDKLAVCKANMRHAKKPPDISDILPSVRARGVLVPLLVRADGSDKSFEIVAGRRRFEAAKTVAAEAETKQAAPELPCAILDDGDDADAVEVSLIENLARLDPDEVTQWETFTRLVREGRSVADISATFGLPERAVERILALGNLCPRIRNLYRREEIDPATVRHLTMASKAQQKAWLALLDDEEAYLPTGHQLKAWLFGGASISTDKALFDLERYKGQIVADLFGEEGYFADADAFWEAQNAAVDDRRAAYLEAGWADVVIVPPTAHFSSWEYEKTTKCKGGRVYIDIRANGEVTFHEGYISRKEAERARRGEGGDAPRDKPKRPELTGPMQNYVDLHRHAAVRAALCSHPSVALRLMVAHAVAGSHLWNLRVEPQDTRRDDVRESVEASKGQSVFDKRRRAVLGLLGFAPEEPTVTGGGELGVAGIFARLMALPEPCVTEVIAIVMGETLAAGSAAIEAVGAGIGVDMADWWEADEAFFALLRDKKVATALVAEVAGDTVATANAGETVKAQKAIVADHLTGSNGREKTERWVPRWMRFPPEAYTERGGVGTVATHAQAVYEAERAEEIARGADTPDAASGVPNELEADTEPQREAA